MGKTFILIHGRSYKPARNQLRKLWIEALARGIRRDFGSQKETAFRAAKVEFVYFGDESAKVLAGKKEPPDPAADLADRRAALKRLEAFSAARFTAASYRKLPGLSKFKEVLADSVGAFLGVLHMAQPLIELEAPDMKEYWSPYSEFGSELRWRFGRAVRRAMNREDRILVIAHSLGSMVAWDVLWTLSHSVRLRSRYGGKKVDLWITIGCPLGDETVKRNLRGAGAAAERRYPTNIRRWLNICAEDDYICHDELVRDDFQEMESMGLEQRIEDQQIYNLSLRHGKANPHHSSGYLIHPRMARAVAEWI